MRFDYSQCDDGRANIAYAKKVLEAIWEHAGAQDVLTIDRYAHPVGGCRMGRSSEDGVIDREHRVFGVPNLFVACSAVRNAAPSASAATFAASASGSHGRRLARSLPPVVARTTVTPQLTRPSAASGTCSVAYASGEASTRSDSRKGSGGSARCRRIPIW